MIYDISVALSSETKTYEGDPFFEIEKLEFDTYTISKISLGTHTGTHIDAPSHYIDDGASIDEIPVSDLVCLAEVTESNFSLKTPAVLFKNYSEMSEEFAKSLLAEVKIVGCDSLSIGSDEVHKILLEAGVIIIEMLDLSSVSDGIYKMTALPLKISGADAAPARVILEDL